MKPEIAQRRLEEVNELKEVIKRQMAAASRERMLAASIERYGWVEQHRARLMGPLPHLLYRAGMKKAAFWLARIEVLWLAYPEADVILGLILRKGSPVATCLIRPGEKAIEGVFDYGA